MDELDKELLHKLILTDIKLRRLFHEHEKLEGKLARFEHRGFLTSSEEVELKKLKKKKLSGVDRMMELMEEHRA